MMRGMVLPILILLAGTGSAWAQPIGELHDHDAHERDFSGPVAHIVDRSINLGQVREGTVATGTFLVENQGEKDLVIEEVRTTCGCTTVELTDDEKVIKPGEAREIVINFDTTRRIGVQRKPAFLTLNDPYEPRVTLTLIADVVSIFKILPAPLVNLRSVHRGDALPPVEVFPAESKDKLESVTVEIPDGLLTYQEVAITDPANGHGVRLTFKIPEQIDLGLVNSHVTVGATVNGEQANMSVRVTGQVVGDLVARPVSLQSLAPTPRGHRFAPITIATTNETTFNILGVDAGPHIKVDYQMLQTDTSFSVRAELLDSAPDGPLATTIVVRTDNSGQPILRIPLFAAVQPRYQLDPEIALLGPRWGVSRKIRIRGPVNLKLDIRSISCDDPRVDAKILDADVEYYPNVRSLTVKLRDGETVDEDFKATIELTTNIEGAGPIRIPIEYRAGR